MEWKEKRTQKANAEHQQKLDEIEYRQYQEELRKMTNAVVEEQRNEKRKPQFQSNHEVKQKQKILDKMNQLYEMKKTLEISEWKQLKEKEKEEEQRQIREENKK